MALPGGMTKMLFGALLTGQQDMGNLCPYLPPTSPTDTISCWPPWLFLCFFIEDYLAGFSNLPVTMASVTRRTPFSLFPFISTLAEL